ncbi:Por secretion system C-terminal sorting domain-containing protein [Catalinimonas alkaloidigena]|uniref:Por secretion system C-terminal sorting domain-containing protein n=1 Tax=Catalinimonas alkaloidigena TaxID=1075417 RepID=A0A1G8XD43_9BACT|nr:tail fiber domain-containing protein [Catalinimonas alkaloidigena]SDJ88274.1 Por secretion system C-terminal sorting domain-containing protein [Catalinimonas alkaloidigena]
MGNGAGVGSSGSNNIFLGNYSGRVTIGSLNTFLGNSTGWSTTTGDRNTFIGNVAGYNNTTASSNTFLGDGAGYRTTTGGYNTFIGQGASGNNTGGIYGTSVGYRAGESNTTGIANSFFGTVAGPDNTTGRYNAYFGYFSGQGSTTGSGNTFIGSYSRTNPNLSNASAIGYRAYVTASNALVLGSVSGTNGATANTNVGIGTTAPSYRLHVNANSAAKPGSSAWTVASDKRLKKDIRPFEEGLAVIDQIRPVRYRYNGKAGLSTDEEFVGIIAQEVQEVAPYMVGEWTYQDTTGAEETYLDYDANAMTYLLINAVKELKSQNEALQDELTALRQTLGLSPTTSAAVKARLWQNQPNPANGTTLIRYQVPASAQSAQLRVVSILGQEVFQQVTLDRGEGEISVEVGQLPSGTYLYQLIVDGRTVDTKKMILAH